MLQACQWLWSFAAGSRKEGPHSPGVRLVQCEMEVLYPCIRSIDVPAILGPLLHETRVTSSLLVNPTSVLICSQVRIHHHLNCCAAEASANACNSRIAALRLMCEYSSGVAAWLIRSVVDRS